MSDENTTDTDTDTDFLQRPSAPTVSQEAPNPQTEAPEPLGDATCSACFSRDSEGVWVKIMVNGVGKHILLDSFDEDAIISFIQNTQGALGQYTIGDHHWSPHSETHPVNEDTVNPSCLVANELQFIAAGKGDHDLSGLGSTSDGQRAGGEPLKSHESNGFWADVNVVGDADKSSSAHEVGGEFSAERKAHTRALARWVTRLVGFFFSRDRIPEIGFILWAGMLVSWGSEIVENRDRIIALEAASNPTTQSEEVLMQSPTSRNPKFAEGISSSAPQPEPPVTSSLKPLTSSGTEDKGNSGDVWLHHVKVLWKGTWWAFTALGLVIIWGKVFLPWRERVYADKCLKASLLPFSAERRSDGTP